MPPDDRELSLPHGEIEPSELRAPAPHESYAGLRGSRCAERTRANVGFVQPERLDPRPGQLEARVRVCAETEMKDVGEGFDSLSIMPSPVTESSRATLVGYDRTMSVSLRVEAPPTAVRVAPPAMSVPGPVTYAVI